MGKKQMIGSVISITILVLATSYLAENRVLWVMLLLLNFPIYRSFAGILFRDSEHMKWSLQNILHSDSIRSTDDEVWAGYYGWLFIALCLAVVTAEYKIISWLFIDPK